MLLNVTIQPKSTVKVSYTTIVLHTAFHQFFLETYDLITETH